MLKTEVIWGRNMSIKGWTGVRKDGSIWKVRLKGEGINLWKSSF